MLTRTGVPASADLDSTWPSGKSLSQGPVAVFECFQRIPCDPCYTACKFGAVQEFQDINDLPRVLHEKCNGCGVCVTRCPGLAIFIVDRDYSETQGVVRMPYEYLPLPEAGEEVDALDREGNVIGVGRVVRVVKGPRLGTPVVWLAVDKELLRTARNLRLRRGASDEDIIICRCEDITLAKIKAMIRDGYVSMDHIKHLTRCGMGPCQGKTCRPLLAQEVARALGKGVAEVKMTTFRPPSKPITIANIVRGVENG